MKRLPFLFFAAAVAIWGLASIPDGRTDDKLLQVSAVRTAASHRHGQSAGIPRDAFMAPRVTASSVRAARLDRCGDPTGRSELGRPSSACPSVGGLGDNL